MNVAEHKADELLDDLKEFRQQRISKLLEDLKNLRQDCIDKSPGQLREILPDADGMTKLRLYVKEIEEYWRYMHHHELAEKGHSK